ncbi:VirB8/TrbF family protein [Acidithiobacillus sp.]|uniref:VirB8/TrbF family protein n=1 Tax=Acidithiobacillus sp. TaxID=1872118 RepID=UPI003D068EFC
MAKEDSANPYLNARREWDERYGDALTRAQNWRLFAFGAIGVAAVACLGIAYIGAQSKIKPYVVAIDRMGNPIAMAQPVAGGAVNQRIIEAQVANWVWGHSFVATPEQQCADLRQCHPVRHCGDDAADGQYGDECPEQEPEYPADAEDPAWISVQCPGDAHHDPAAIPAGGALMLRRVVDGEILATINWNMDARVEHCLRAMTDGRRGGLARAVVRALEIGIPALDDLPEENRARLWHGGYDALSRITTSIPRRYEMAIRSRARHWGVPIHRVFSEAVRAGQADLFRQLGSADILTRP